jgi:hypothetical protein
LLEKAEKYGVALRQAGTRTVVLDVKIAGKLGVAGFLKRVQELTGRKNENSMGYRSISGLNKRGENIQFDPDYEVEKLIFHVKKYGFNSANLTAVTNELSSALGMEPEHCFSDPFGRDISCFGER